MLPRRFPHSLRHTGRFVLVGALILAGLSARAEHGGGDADSGVSGGTETLDLSGFDLSSVGPDSGGAAPSSGAGRSINLADPNLEAAAEAVENEVKNGSLPATSAGPILQKIAPLVEKMEAQAEANGNRDPRILVSIIPGVKLGSKSVLIEAAAPGTPRSGGPASENGQAGDGSRIVSGPPTPAVVARNQVAAGFDLAGQLVDNGGSAKGADALALRTNSESAPGSPAGRGVTVPSVAAVLDDIGASPSSSGGGRRTEAPSRAWSRAAWRAAAQPAPLEARAPAANGSGFSVLGTPVTAPAAPRITFPVRVEKGALDDALPEADWNWKSWLGSLFLIFGAYWGLYLPAGRFFRR